MGKGNRVRADRAEKSLGGNGGKQPAKKAWVVPVIAAVVMLVIIACIVLAALSANGTFLRSQAVVSSDHFSVTGTMFQYYFMDTFAYYMSAVDTSSAMYSSLESFYRQYYSSSAYSYALSQSVGYLELCEGALADGITLDEEEIKSIDSAINYYSTLAKAAGFSSVNAYLTNTYGSGVKLKDIRAFYELQALAVKYQEVLENRCRDGLTDEDLETYYQTNYKKYMTADIISYTFKAEQATVSSTGFDSSEKYAEAVQEAENQFSKDCIDIRKKAEALKATTTQEAFEAYVTGLGEDEKVTTSEGVTYKEEDELSTWLFGDTQENAAALNATTAIEESAEKKLEITVYMVIAPISRNEAQTKNIAFLIGNATGFKAEDAEAFANEFTDAGVMTRDDFLSRAESITVSHTASTQDNVSKGDLGVLEHFDAWIETEEATPGTVKVFQELYNSIDYNLVVFVDGLGLYEWQKSAQNGIITDTIQDWLEDAEATYHVTVHEEVAKKVVN